MGRKEHKASKRKENSHVATGNSTNQLDGTTVRFSNENNWEL
jgi:hypothetical protein